ncbi:MAG: transglycosylase SLT domain-containing protein [Burkholderiales bacterium]|nr:transglycosylase SLT domain-containing protein [Burkholderiales bacterium]
MSAKSILELFSLELNRTASRVRSTVSVLVLIASVAALLLIINNQHSAHFFSDSYSRVLSLGTAKPSVAEGSTPAAAQSADASHTALAEFLAKRYKVSLDVTHDLVSIAYGAGHQFGLDPLLIIAVISVESRFNPIAESVAGAKGLMQIIPKYHTEKFEALGGVSAVFNPATNILVGSKILKEYLGRTGNLSMALQMYAGALSDDQDVYTNKVMNEKQRLQHIVGQAARALRVKSTAPRSAALSSPL